MIAEARRQGKRIEQNPFGIEYVVGQSQGSVNEQMDEWRKSREGVKATRNGPAPAEPEEVLNSEPMEGVEQSAEPDQLFVVDSNPTPVNVLQNKSDASSKGKNRANDKAKRRVSLQDEQSNVPPATEEGHKKKKVKVAEAETAQSYEPKPLREEDDISAEVDARLKEKEERRKRKEEKKRKRESAASQADVPEDLTEELAATKPTKKKHKKAEGAKDAEQAAEPSVAEEAKPKNDKKKKKKRASTDAEPEGTAVTDEKDKSKKKRKKESKEITA